MALFSGEIAKIGLSSYVNEITKITHVLHSKDTVGVSSHLAAAHLSWPQSVAQYGYHFYYSILRILKGYVCYIFFFKKATQKLLDGL